MKQREWLLPAEFLRHLKQHKGLILQMIIFGLFPLICAEIYCLKDAHRIRDIYLPMSYWNDELFYYKQVEAVVHYNLPQGWFGFLEQHANRYPFAAWSPTILLPWVIWGKMFGWNLLSPIYVNILCNMAAMAVFAVLIRPSVKQSVILLALMMVFTPYTRYMLSGMPEALFMAAGIIFSAVTISYIRKEKLWKLVVMFLIPVYFTLSRPYLGMLFLIPVWYAFRRNRRKGSIISLSVVGGTLGGYVLLTKLCTAPYLEPIVKTSWLRIFVSDGLAAGIRYVFLTLKDNIIILFEEYLKRAVKFGLFSGSLYALVGLTALFLLFRFVWAWKKGKEKELRTLALFQFFMTAGMVLAIFFFYKLGEGSKHLMIFILMSLILIALMEEKYYFMKIFAGSLCFYFFVIKALAPYDWQVAYDDSGMGMEARSLEAQLDETMALSSQEDFTDMEEYRYDNTVIWLSYDIIGEETVTEWWGLLYMIPKGFGINHCSQTYVMEHFDELRSGYIAALPGGQVEERLLQADAELIAETEHMCVYRMP